MVLEKDSSIPTDITHHCNSNKQVNDQFKSNRKILMCNINTNTV